MNKNSDIRGSIVIDVFRTSHILERVGRKLVYQVGLTGVHQWFILGALDQEGELTMKELKDKTLVTKQNMTGVVKRLELGGYVATYKAPFDHRIRYVKITDKGTHALQALDQISNKSHDITFKNFDVAELELMKLQFDKLVKNLSEQLNDC